MIANPAKPAHFLGIYRSLFADVPRPFTLLEIGVHTGGSMRLWREWFPDCHIYGLDHDLSQSGPIEGVTLVQGEQNDPRILEELVKRSGGFDVVIDDGSHIWHDQLESFAALWPDTRAWYAIEDTWTSYPGTLPEDTGQWAHGPNTMDRLKKRVDALHQPGQTGSIHFYPGLAVMAR